jgi:hypothetical protein
MACGCGKRKGYGERKAQRQAQVTPGVRRAPQPGDARPFKRVSYHIVNDETHEVVKILPTLAEANSMVRKLGASTHRIEVRR